jgi:uncharacterized protein (UPF0264 family)
VRLLVSASSAADASAALLGGADIIDAKDPLSGSLGAVAPGVFRDIAERVRGLRPVTAALGDALDEESLEGLARRFATAGAAFVKVGFAGIVDSNRVRALLAAATRGVRTCRSSSASATGVIAVAYADATRAVSLSPGELLDVAADACASGVLLDTFDKAREGLITLAATPTLARWVADAHDVGLIAAVAGKLSAGDIPLMRAIGADIAGVRGAACEGGRTGVVVAENVRMLRGLCVSDHGPAEAGHYA